MVRIGAIAVFLVLALTACQTGIGPEKTPATPIDQAPAKAISQSAPGSASSVAVVAPAKVEKKMTIISVSAAEKKNKPVVKSVKAVVPVVSRVAVKPPTAKVTIKTQPRGGVVSVLGTRQKLIDGETHRFKAGRYTLVARKKGYRDGRYSLLTDGKRRQSVVVKLGAGFGSLSLQTQPTGATIIVDGKHRGRSPLEMETVIGTHDVIARLKGYVPRSAKATVSAAAVEIVDLKLQKIVVRPVLSAITVRTVPPGAVVTVKETGKRFNDGETLDLKAGRYTLLASKRGYRQGSQLLLVTGRDAQAITVKLGPGFGRLSVLTQPMGAEIVIDGKVVGKSPLEREVEAGNHEVRVVLDGYRPQSAQASVSPAAVEIVDLQLPKIITHGTAEITTVPVGGAIQFSGQSIGVGSATVGPLLFGRYQVSAAKNIVPARRIVGQTTFTLSTAGPLKVELNMTTSQRLFDGKWLAEKEAIALEQRRYKNQEMAAPVEVTLRLDQAGFVSLLNIPKLAESLLSVLRIGDRVRLVFRNNSWLLWKRHNILTPDFEYAVKAFLTNKGYRPPWETTNRTVRVVTADDRKEPLFAIAYALHRSRAETALLDLPGSLLLAAGESVVRSAGDGEITVLVMGGKKVVIAGVTMVATGPISIARVPVGNQAITISWQRVPKQLLVISDKTIRLNRLPKGISLKSREKKILSLLNSAVVTRLVRYSVGPDYKRPRRVVLRKQGPLAAQIDLTSDEIGPNQRMGAYRNIWIVEFARKNGATQRQTEVSYRVLDQVKKTVTDRFLRVDKQYKPQ